MAKSRKERRVGPSVTNCTQWVSNIVSYWLQVLELNQIKIVTRLVYCFVIWAIILSSKELHNAHILLWWIWWFMPLVGSRRQQHVKMPYILTKCTSKVLKIFICFLRYSFQWVLPLYLPTSLTVSALFFPSPIKHSKYLTFGTTALAAKNPKKQPSLGYCRW